MDPNETLSRLRRLAAVEFLSPEEAAEMAELFQALDRWLSMTGGPPKDWGKAYALGFAKAIFGAEHDGSDDSFVTARFDA